MFPLARSGLLTNRERMALERRPATVFARAIAALLAPALAGCLTTAQAPPPPAPKAGARLEGPVAPPAARDPSPAEEAQRKRRAERIQGLIRELDHQDQNRVYYAAVELLRMWTDDLAQQPAERTPPLEEMPGLRAIAKLLGDGRVEQQRTLVKAIGQYVTFPGGNQADHLRATRLLVPLLAPFLAHADKDLRKDAIDSLAALDAIGPEENAPDAVDVLIVTSLDTSRTPPPSPAEIQSAIRIIGRKPPKAAVPQLIRALERFPKQLEVRAAAYEELHEVTGYDFRELARVKQWWELNSARRPEDWYRERLRQKEEESARRARIARDWWERYAKAISSDPKTYALLLRDSLLDPIPQIRSESARQLAELGRPECFDALVEAVGMEKETEVLRAIFAAIAQMAQTPPEEDREARVRAARALAKHLIAVERDVRMGAVETIAAVGVDERIPDLIARLRLADRDAEVAAAILKALARIGARTRPDIVDEIVSFLEREWKRDPKDPLRDPRLFRECAAALSVLAEKKDIAPGSPEARRAVAALAPLLAHVDPTTPVAVNTRQFAAIALGKVGHVSGLAPLYQRLVPEKEPDESVAQYAATAVGEIACADVPAEARREALATLRAAFDARREPQLKEACFKAIRAILKQDPGDLTQFEQIAEKLATLGDHGRIAKLLESLPEKPPATTDALYLSLRERQARAYELGKDYKAAVEVWAKLAEKEPRFKLDHANALGLAARYDDADRIYEELLRKALSPTDAARVWARRPDLVRWSLEASDRAQATRLAQRMLAGTGPLSPPADARDAINRLLEQAPGATPVDGPELDREKKSGGTVPGGFPLGNGGFGPSGQPGSPAHAGTERDQRH